MLESHLTGVAISKSLRNAFAILICSGVRHSGCSPSGRAVRAPALARHRRVRRAGPTRLTDFGRSRPSIRCDVLSQVRPEFTIPSRARGIDRMHLPFAFARVCDIQAQKVAENKQGYLGTWLAKSPRSTGLTNKETPCPEAHPRASR